MAAQDLARRARPHPRDASLTVGPFFRWAGGKRRIVRELEKRIPSSFKGRYFEPFLGSGALFFHLVQNARLRAGVFLSDGNRELVRTYHAVLKWPARVHAQLVAHERAHSPVYYFTQRRVRSLNLAPAFDVDVAARFLYLNHHAFNGLYRVNREGMFNVPMGVTSRPLPTRETLQAVGQTLRCAVLSVGDFEKTLRKGKPRRGDLVYFDPPYVPISETSNFTDYSPQSFGMQEHMRLRDVARTLKEHGIHILLSNSDSAVTRKLYRGFTLESIAVHRSISARSDRRGPVSELIVT